MDWRNYSLSDDEVVEEAAEPETAKPAAVEPEEAKPAAAVEPSAKDVAAVPVPADPTSAVSTVETKPVPDVPIPTVETSVAVEAASVSTVETNDAEETVSDEPVPDVPIPAVEMSEAEELVLAEDVPAVETNETEEAASVSVLAEDVPDVETNETNETSEEEPVHTVEQREADKEADQAAIEALTEILEEEQIDGDYISLDDFNLEPSEAEMHALEEAIKTDELLAEDVGRETTDTGRCTDKEEAADAGKAVGETADNAAADAEKPTEREAAVAAVDETVKLRISRLGKDATSSVYEDLLVTLASDIEVAKAVTGAVIKDHTRRHKGTAPQRAFLAWLENQ